MNQKQNEKSYMVKRFNKEKKGYVFFYNCPFNTQQSILQMATLYWLPPEMLR